MIFRKEPNTTFGITPDGVPGNLGTTPGAPRREPEKHTFKNSSDAFQTAPKDLYTLLRA